MTLKRILLYCSLVALSLSGCQKDSETIAPSNTNTTKLTASAWHITSYTRTIGSGVAVSFPTDVFPQNCSRDDRYTFKSTKVVERNEYAQACGNNAPQSIIETFPWDFNSAQTQLILNGVPFDVVQLTSDIMQLRWTRMSNGATVVDNVSYAN